MAGGQGTNSNFTVFWVLRCQNRRGKIIDQQRKFATKPDLFDTLSANYHYYLSSFFMLSLYLRKMPGRTLKVYVEDKCCVKY